MLLQIIPVLFSLQLILGYENSFTGKCHINTHASDILNAAIDLIEKGRNLNEKCAEGNGANFILDSAVDLIKKTKVTSTNCEIKAVDCEELMSAGFHESGNYTIWPRNRVNEGKPVKVYCDMQTDGGGWTVIQRRGDFGKPENYFHKNWLSYKSGFGNINEDFWLGNDNIFSITDQKVYSVRFDLQTIEGEKAYALYNKFWIEDETRNYTLHIYDYSGTAGDSMKYHNNNQFFTKDKDTKFNCAQNYKGAWWYVNCHNSNLNGLYIPGVSSSTGVHWQTFNKHGSLKSTEIKIRPRILNRKN